MVLRIQRLLMVGLFCVSGMLSAGCGEESVTTDECTSDGDCPGQQVCQTGICVEPVGDEDADGVEDDADNCPNDANADQADADADGAGDVCDACPQDAADDADGDGVCGDADNCPNDANADQADADADGAGDVCDACPQDAADDADGDGVCGDADNCPTDTNADQADADVDGAGDACDACPQDAADDADGDGICGDVDNCPTDTNADQADADVDGAGDACDACPQDAADDADGDGVCGDVDNCPTDTNADQADADADGAGDACDTCPQDAADDADEDGLCADVDNCPNDSNADQTDTDQDGLGDACDDSLDCTENDHLVCTPSAGAGGSVAWVDRCGQLGDVVEVCHVTNGLCVESVDAAACECTGKWDLATGCEGCLGNWDPAAGCASCLTHWQDAGNQCGLCPDPWDSALGCNDCEGNTTVASGCAECMPDYNGDYCNCGFSGTVGPVRDMWQAPTGEVFAVGHMGLIRIHDGTGWQVMHSGTSLDLETVWGFAVDQVFATGVDGVMRYYNGQYWQGVETDLTATAYNALWGANPNDIWAVGNAGAIGHFDGVRWTDYPSPTDAFLFDILGYSHDEIYAVGTIFDTPKSSVVLAFDGTDWTVVPNVPDGGLLAIDGVSAGTFYAAGYAGTVLKYTDGTFQTLTQAGSLDLPTIAVQDDQTVFVGVSSTGLVRRTEGGDWQDEHTFGDGVLDLFFTAGGELLASGADHSLARRTISGVWSEDVGPTGYVAGMNGVWVRSAELAYAVGDGGTILRWNGTSWTKMDSPVTNALQDVFGVPTGIDEVDVYAVGNSGTILKLNNATDTWEQMTSNTNASLNAIWGELTTGIFAVGSDGGKGIIMELDSGTWGVHTENLANPLNGISGFWLDQTAVAVGPGGCAYLYNGVDQFDPIPTGGTEYLLDVYARSENEFIAAGTANTILRYDRVEGTWTLEGHDSPDTETFYSVWNSYAVSYSGKVFLYDSNATTWVQKSDAQRALYAVAGTSFSNSFAVGMHGIVVHHSCNLE